MIQYGAMKHWNWNRVEEESLNPLLTRKAVHGATMTVARIRLRKFAIVPMHSHANEQISLVESGRLRFVIDGQEIQASPGDVILIPAHAAHKVEALEDSVAMDVFSPPREDWIRGDDAYLR
jgi:quercetin dioxygenase-like cupin family protein